MADNNNNKKKGGQPQSNKGGKQPAEKAETPKQAAVEPAPAPAPVVVVPAQPVQPVVAPTTEDANANKEGKKEKKQPFQREQGKGIVKAVPSGDTILVIVHNPTKIKQGPPEEREITISNINAPRLGRRKSQKSAGSSDEPFAWQSRDYLRKKVIGKPVSFVIEYKTESKNYGVVHLLDNKGGSSENLATAIVSEGWAKVRAQKDDQQVRPDVAELLDAQEQAKTAFKGLYTNDPNVIAKAVRANVEVQTADLFEQLKGQTVTAFVEQVLTGTRIRVILLPSFYNITVLLSGAESPDVTPERAEPFGREAKFFVEHFLLHRDVQLVLEGMDKFNLYGTLSLGGHNIAEELLRSGLAKYVDWSGNRSPNSEKLRAAERAGKDKKIRLWAAFEEPKALSRQDEKAKLKAGKEIIGKVTKIINAGAIKVVDNAGREHEVFLSSIKLAFQGNPVAQQNEAREVAFRRSLGWEGKEYLRRRLIGQRVRAVCDYIRTAAQTQEIQQQAALRNKNINNNNNANKRDTPLPDRAYYSVYLDKNNVAVELVDLGYASAQDHRAGEARTKDYEEVLFAEQRAKRASKGVHASLDKAPIVHINDLSRADDQGAKAKQFFPSLKRLGRARGVVEYIFSAGRLKIYVPKEACQINLLLSGVTLPRTPEDPFYAEATQFANEKALQRDIEFEVLTQDKRGNFIGNIWLSKEENLATLYLEQGFGYINYATVQDNPLQTEFVIAEEAAKKKHLNVWADYDEAKEAEERAKRAAARSEAVVKPQQEFIDVVITEIVDATKFYVQITNENTKLDELMKALSLNEDNTPYAAEVNELVKAQFTADDAWYRARVIERTAEGEYAVFYIDYGNTETVPAARIRELKEEETTLAPQAKQARLAYVAPPRIEDDYGPEAAEFFRDLVWGKTMMANVESRDVISKDSEVLHLSLGDRESQVHVNAALVRAGLARVERVRSRHLQPMIEKLREEESKARADHSYIWEYGDPGSDDEDDTPFGRRKPAPGAPAQKK